MSDILRYLSGDYAVLAVTRDDPLDRQCHRTRAQTGRKILWLTAYCLLTAGISFQIELVAWFHGVLKLRLNWLQNEQGWPVGWRH